MFHLHAAVLYIPPSAPRLVVSSYLAYPTPVRTSMRQDYYQWRYSNPVIQPAESLQVRNQRLIQAQLAQKARQLAHPHTVQTCTNITTLQQTNACLTHQ